MYGLSCISMLSAKAACILCGSNNPAGVDSCGITPLAVTPTITNLSATSISCNVVDGVFTKLIHLRPKLSVLTGLRPFTLISCIPLSFVFIT